MYISGRAAVVTGGASGIGQAVARRIYADGGNIIIFDLNAEAGAAMVEEMGADRCHFAQVNVADEASVQAGVDSGIDKFGAIYAVVNCAGIANAAKTVGRDGAFPLDLWDKVIAVNQTGVFYCLKEELKIMTKQEKILEIESLKKKSSELKKEVDYYNALQLALF